MTSDLPPSVYTQERADFRLNYLFQYWEGMDRLAKEEWPEWNEDSRMDFFIEQGVPNSAEGHLERWHAEGKLTPEQEARYAELVDLIARMKPIRDGLEQD